MTYPDPAVAALMVSKAGYAQERADIVNPLIVATFGDLIRP